MRVSQVQQNDGSANGVPKGTWLPEVAIRLEQAGSTLALASENGLYFTRDNGEAWQQADVPGRRIGGFAAVEDTLLGSTEHGLHVSGDGGQRWSRVPEEEAEGRFPFLQRIGETDNVLAASSTEGLQTIGVSVQVGRNRARQSSGSSSPAAR